MPKEIGNLTQLKLLHLHSNEFIGAADHFSEHNSIESFTSDCGNTAITESLVECKTCTECCNQDKQCITETKTWPKKDLKDLKSMLSVTSAACIFTLMFICSLFIIFVAMFLFLFKDVLPKFTYVCGGDEFQKGSVCRFFLSSNKLA